MFLFFGPAAVVNQPHGWPFFSKTGPGISAFFLHTTTTTTTTTRVQHSNGKKRTQQFFRKKSRSFKNGKNVPKIKAFWT